MPSTPKAVIANIPVNGQEVISCGDAMAKTAQIVAPIVSCVATALIGSRLSGVTCLRVHIAEKAYPIVQSAHAV